MRAERGPFFSAAAWASFLIPLAFALSRIDGLERWEQDVSVIRALDLVQLGGEGVLSASLGAVLTLLPLGTVLMRLSLLSAAAVGVAGYLSFRLAHSLLRPGPFRAPLALCGALVAVLASAWQSSAVAVGGPALGAALALWWSSRLRRGSCSDDPRSWIAYGVALGLLTLESRILGLVGVLPLLVRCGLTVQLPALRDLVLLFGAGFAVWAVGLLPSLLDAGPRGFAFGLDVAIPELPPAQSVISISDLGPYLLGLAALGLVFSVWTPQRREAALLLVPWVLASAVLDSPVLDLVAIAALGALSSAGLVGIHSGLRVLRLPGERNIARLGGFAHLCALLLLVEGAEQHATQRTLTATREWSEQAFERLPADSLLLVSSPEAALRLWSSRVTSGIRPDVVLVPSSLLSQRRWANQLLEVEPKLAALIRDVATQGKPGEYALAELADARPLRVEVDAQWDKSLLRHLTADGLWFRFASHATGRTDRNRAQATLRRAMNQVYRRAQNREGRDVRTLQRLREDIHRQAAVATLLRDKEDAALLLRALERMGAPKATLSDIRDALENGDAAQPSVLLTATAKR